MAEDTQQQKREQPVHFVLSIIGNKWAILILNELFAGNRRTKTLTARLRELERCGLVQRRAYPEVPPRVEYSLTAKGYELRPVLVALKQVGQRWLT